MIELLLQAERALSVGLLDRAETLYAQVASADPRNSIAVVGLARVALDRGNEAEALAMGRRALEIDPENDAARRLVQRLEEVRAYRGEAAGVSEAERVPAGAATTGAGAAAAGAEPARVEVPSEPGPVVSEPSPAPSETAMPGVPAPAPSRPEPAPPERAAPPEPPAPPEPSREASPTAPASRSWLDRLTRRGR